MVTWSGLTELAASLLHVEKLFAPMAAAVSMTTVPAACLPPVQLVVGLGVMVPELGGALVVVNV